MLLDQPGVASSSSPSCGKRWIPQDEAVRDPPRASRPDRGRYVGRNPRPQPNNPPLTPTRIPPPASFGMTRPPAAHFAITGICTGVIAITCGLRPEHEYKDVRLRSVGCCGADSYAVTLTLEQEIRMQTTNANPQHDDRVDRLQAYEPPQLTPLGDVRLLTLGRSTGLPDSGGLTQRE